MMTKTQDQEETMIASLSGQQGMRNNPNEPNSNSPGSDTIVVESLLMTQEKKADTRIGVVTVVEIEVGSGLAQLRRIQNGWTSLLKNKQRQPALKRTSSAGKSV